VAGDRVHPRPVPPPAWAEQPTVAFDRRPGPPPLPPRALPVRRPGPPGARRLPRRTYWRRRIVAVLVLLLVAAAGFATHLDLGLARIDALPGDGSVTSKGTNWLIVGSDSREGLTAEQRRRLATGGDVGRRTDTIILLHRGSNGTVLVSLPRDSLLAVPGHGRDKLNAAYSYGGAKLLVRTVERATGLRIDHYVEIGLDGFVDAVDALGGVEICPGQAIRDPKAGLDVQAGCQEADSATALGYVRTRQTPGDDFARTERQREFLANLVDRATSPLTLLNPFRIVPFTTAASRAITVDAGTHMWHLAQLALAMRAVSSDGQARITVPVRNPDAHVDGASVVLWNDRAAAALFTALRNDTAAPTR